MYMRGYSKIWTVGLTCGFALAGPGTEVFSSHGCEAVATCKEPPTVCAPGRSIDRDPS